MRRSCYGENYFCQRGNGSRQRKKTTLVKMLAKLIVTLPHPSMYSHFFSHDLKELDILVRPSAGIILMYYSFAFVTTNLRPAVYLQIRLQSPRVRIHILKFSREKNSYVMQFVVLCSFLCCISCTSSI